MQYVGPLSLLTKVLLSAIGLWCLVLVVLFVFPHLLPIISGFAGLLSLPVALALMILALVALFVDKYKLWPALCVVIVLFVVYLTIFHMMYWGALANFYINKSKYQATAMRMIAAKSDEERKQICGEDCWITSTTPTRVGFHYVHGFLNWHDIVYDPGGSLMKATTSEERFRISQNFVSAQHLAGDWYLEHEGD